MPEDITSSALPNGETNVDPVGGTEAVSETSPNTLPGVKDVISQITGKNFPTDEAAVKSLKDTYAFVGSTGMKAQKLMKELQTKLQTDEHGVLNLMENLVNNPVTPQQTPVSQNPQVASGAPVQDTAVLSEIAQLRKQVEESQFFDERPELKEYRGTIAELRDATGKPIREVVELPAIKNLVDKARSFDEAERSRSVLHSNPKLGQVRDKISEAQEALKTGDFNRAKEGAVSSVVDAFLR